MLVVLTKFSKGDRVVCMGKSAGFTDADLGFAGAGWKPNLVFVIDYVSEPATEDPRGRVYFPKNGNGVYEKFLMLDSDWDQ